MTSEQYDKPGIAIMVSNVPVTSKKFINILGVMFNCKMDSDLHIAKAFQKQRNPYIHSRLQPKWNENSSSDSIGHSHAFYVIFVPLEYVPTIPPHSTKLRVPTTY